MANGLKIFKKIILNVFFASFRGVNAILGDYFWRPGLPLAKALWLLLSLLTCGGLLYINAHDVGVCHMIAMIMRI